MMIIVLKPLTIKATSVVIVFPCGIEIMSWCLAGNCMCLMDRWNSSILAENLPRGNVLIKTLVVVAPSCKISKVSSNIIKNN